MGFGVWGLRFGVCGLVATRTQRGKACVALEGGGDNDGASDSAGHVGGGSDDDSLEEAGSGDHRHGDRRFKAEYATTARSKCALTGVLIAQGAVRVLRDRLPTVPGGVGIPVTWSLAGLTDALSRDGSGALRRAVDRGIDGLGLLRPADRLAVELATSEQLVREVQAARALPAITPPAPDAQAWTCPRCGKVYVKMQYARQHATNADCKPRRVRRVVPAVEEPPPGHWEEAAWDVAGAHAEAAACRQRGAVGQSPVELPRRMLSLRAPPVVHRPPARSLRQLPVAGKPATAARG